jgi:hypothetical protein
MDNNLNNTDFGLMRQSSVPNDSGIRVWDFGTVAPRRAFSEGGNGLIDILGGNRTGNHINMSQMSGRNAIFDMGKYESAKSNLMGNAIGSVGGSVSRSFDKIISNMDKVSGSVSPMMAAFMQHVQVEAKPLQINLNRVSGSGTGMFVEFGFAGRLGYKAGAGVLGASFSPSAAAVAGAAGKGGFAGLVGSAAGNGSGLFRVPAHLRGM